MLYYYLKLKIIIEDALAPDEKAQTLVEYGLILVFIAVVLFATVSLLGGQVNNLFNRVANEVRSP